MYTKDICLKEIGREQFSRYQQYWNSRVNPRGGDVCAQIYNPIVDTNYERLLHRLLDHPLRAVICVNNRGQWIKRDKEGLSDDEIKDLALIAASDSRKRCYLEVKIKREEKRVATKNHATIEFWEYQNQIIGGGLRVHNSTADIFTIEDKVRNWEYMYGLWMPS